MTRELGASASGHWQGACAAAHLLEVRDSQGLWSGTRDQGPAPGLAQAGASPWSLSHHSLQLHYSGSQAAAGDLRVCGYGDMQLQMRVTVSS